MARKREPRIVRVDLSGDLAGEWAEVDASKVTVGVLAEFQIAAAGSVALMLDLFTRVLTDASFADHEAAALPEGVEDTRTPSQRQAAAVRAGLSDLLPNELLACADVFAQLQQVPKRGG